MMKDNELPDDDVPDWMWEIVERHDLSLRASNPFLGGAVLLTDVADLLKEASSQAFRERKMSSRTLRQARKCADTIADAIKLLEFDDQENKKITARRAE